MSQDKVCADGDIVVLGTGGTIAGLTVDAHSGRYEAGQVGVAQLLASAAGVSLPARRVLSEQVAQVDSKDMSWVLWRALGQAIERSLAQASTAAVVVTHGSDTLEETAYLLSRLHTAHKPIVLTAAMRASDAPDADGPANLRDALHLAAWAAQAGVGEVMVTLAGAVWAGAHVRKAHSCALEAFDAGGRPPLARIDAQGRLTSAQAWPEPGSSSPGLGWALLAQAPPRVEVIMSHTDADGWLLEAARAHAGASLQGVVVAATGSGTVHEGLNAALVRAHQAGVCVWVSSRVARGGVRARTTHPWPDCGDLTPAQARVALQLHLLSHASLPALTQNAPKI